MSMEDRLGKCSGLEQREAQNNRVRCYGEQSRVDICRDNHVVDKNRIDADADHDEEALERQSEQALEVVRADAAPFAITHGSNRDRCNADGAVNLNHSTIQDDRDKDGHDLETQTDQQRLYRQAKQLTDTHSVHACLHRGDCCVNVNVGAAGDKASCSCHDILTDVENRHHDVKGVGHEVDRHSRFEKPLEEHPSVHLVHIVFLGDHGNQLVTQHEGYDDTGNGDYHAFG